MKETRITGTACPLYNDIKALYSTSFPIFEQRTEVQQEKAFADTAHYRLAHYSENDTLTGFISYWEFDKYIYIEHFAVSTDIRGKGYGSAILKQFTESTCKMVLLEIDPITDSISQARLRFYKRCGFFENSHEHRHPAYRNGFAPHSLIVLTTLRAITGDEYLTFANDLREVIMK